MESIRKNHHTKILTAITYVYLILPFLIFSAGWMKISFGLPIIIIVLVCAWKAWKETAETWRPEFSRDNIVKILFICIILAIWIYYSGIGYKVFQNQDHHYRNGIFEVLVNSSWPVYNAELAPGVYPDGCNMGAMIYYIAFWMPAAVIGKIFGIYAGYTFQMIWAFAGVILVYYYICARKEKVIVWPLAMLILFSGLDAVGMFITQNNIFELLSEVHPHIEWWIWPYQYSSMTTQLFWVFNQAIPAWLCTIFSMSQTNNKSMVFILSTLMLHSTFPFLGLTVFVLFWMIGRKYDQSDVLDTDNKLQSRIRMLIKDSFTVQNILGGGVIGVFTYLYLRGNVSASEISSQGIIQIVDKIVWSEYFAFILIEIGAYLIITYQLNRRRGIYIVTTLSLLIVPLLKGDSPDFCMRVSIPAMFMLMLIVQDALEESLKDNKHFVSAALIITLCIGSITPINEISRVVKKTLEAQYTNTAIGYTLPEYEILNFPHFTGSVDKNLFFEHVAKHPDFNTN